MQSDKGPCAIPTLWSWMSQWKERESEDCTFFVGIFCVLARPEELVST